MEPNEDQNIPFLELSTLTDLHLDLHFKKTDEDESPLCPFWVINDKLTFSNNMQFKMNSTIQDNNVTYVVDNRFVSINNSFLIIKLPAISIKEELKDKLKISWCNNLANNIVRKAEFRVDGKTYTSINPFILDAQDAFYFSENKSKKELYKECSGNIPFLTEWSTYLPEFTLVVPQKWFYSTQDKAFPLLESKSKIEHVYTFNLDLKKLIRVKVNNSYSTLDLDFIESIVDKIAVPELFGCYEMYTPKTIFDIKEELKTSPKTIYIDDFVLLTAKNKHSYGDTVSVDLNIKSPAISIMWMAENLNSSNKNNYSNYTTNEIDIEAGWNPCKKVSLSYKGGYRFKDWPYYIFDSIFPLNTALSCPDNKGYNLWTSGKTINNLTFETTIDYMGLGAILEITLGDTNPFRKLSTAEENKNIETKLREITDDKITNKNNNTKFQVHVIVHVLKKLEISYINEKIEYKLTDFYKAIMDTKIIDNYIGTTL